ncbi:MAG: sulfotransferase family protein [Myxococcota bacterium]
MQDNLIFLISTPRSGSTLLMRILNATSHIYSRPEPHMMPALAHLGFWKTVDTAPYDQLQAQIAMREFVADLPKNESDYYDACRAYCDTLYGRMHEHMGGGQRYFLDKTPANALVLPFLTKVYPNAKYIILTRHPAAIFASFANSFFDGDYDAAVKFNPILSRYIPVVSAFLKNPTAPHVHVTYEGVASNPEGELRRISEFLDIPFEEDAINYKKADVAAGLGDPIGVQKHDRPVTSSIHKWAAELASDDFKFETVANQLSGLSDEELELWGTTREDLWEPMLTVEQGAYKAKKKKWDRYSSQRRMLVALRKDIHNKPLGRWVKKIRFICDVLLRGS